MKNTLEYSKRRSTHLYKSRNQIHADYENHRPESSRRIIVNRANNATAYYPKGVKHTELHLIESLRNNIDRKIVQHLLDQGHSTFYDIVNHTERAPSTISWHLNRLKSRKLIISTRYYGEPQTYKVMNKNNVTKILSKHTREFV